MALFCFDFDETIVNAHFHNLFSRAGIPPGEKKDEKTKQLLTDKTKDFVNQYGIKNKEQLLSTFRSLLSDGHEIAITSYTLYEEAIKPTLKEMGLQDNELSQILVVGGFPSRNGIRYTGSPDSSFGKEQHIQKAVEFFNLDAKTPIVLLDDSDRNIQIARENQHYAISCPKEPNPDPAYLNELVQLSKNLKQGPKDKEDKNLSQHSPQETKQQQDISQLFANSERKQFHDRPNRVYYAFQNQNEAQAALQQLNQVYGQHAVRLSSMSGHIEIQDRNLLRDLNNATIEQFNSTQTSNLNEQAPNNPVNIPSPTSSEQQQRISLTNEDIQKLKDYFLSPDAIKNGHLDNHKMDYKPSLGINVNNDQVHIHLETYYMSSGEDPSLYDPQDKYFYMDEIRNILNNIDKKSQMDNTQQDREASIKQLLTHSERKSFTDKPNQVYYAFQDHNKAQAVLQQLSQVYGENAVRQSSLPGHIEIQNNTLLTDLKNAAIKQSKPSLTSDLNKKENQQPPPQSNSLLNSYNNLRNNTSSQPPLRETTIKTQAAPSIQQEEERNFNAVLTNILSATDNLLENYSKDDKYKGASLYNLIRDNGRHAQIATIQSEIREICRDSENRNPAQKLDDVRKLLTKKISDIDEKSIFKSALSKNLKNIKEVIDTARPLEQSKNNVIKNKN